MNEGDSQTTPDLHTLLRCRACDAMMSLSIFMFGVVVGSLING